MVDIPQPADDDNAKDQQRRRLIRRLALAGPLVLGLLWVYVFWVPGWMYPSLTDSDLGNVRTAEDKPDAAKIQEFKDARLKLQNDARTTLLQGLGGVLVLTGAGIGAYVAFQQVRATRDQIAQTATDSGNQLKLSEQGLVTDRYTRAVEQLGHEKAPVRLGALYSLEHLAQDNPQYRQTVVDVICAYLRMPYTLPAQTGLGAEQVEEMAPPANGRGRVPHPAPGLDPAREELQVRRTAQRLLADHLHCPPHTSGQDAQLLPPSPQQAFWPGIGLDLTGATLIDFNFHQVSAIQVRFAAATFQGDVLFDGATPQGGGATFQGDARFNGATFQKGAWFNRATFQGDAVFGEAVFLSEAGILVAALGGEKATFQGRTSFTGVTFQGRAVFGGVVFQDETAFAQVVFQDETGFAGATFQKGAWLDGATFQKGAWFDGATFQSAARFVVVTFQTTASFEGATFLGMASFDGAQVLQFNDLERRRVWPDGWTVGPDPTDPSRGTLVRAEPAKEPGPAPPVRPHPDG